MYELIEYYPNAIIELNVEQLTYNKTGFASCLRSFTYYTKKWAYEMAANTKIRSALLPIAKNYINNRRKK